MATVVDRELYGKPRQKHWISYIKQRISLNKNFLGFISGPTGSGKSWTSLSIALDLDPEFTLDRIVFSGLELMNLINSGELKRGSVVVFEEVGVALDAKSWQSQTNKMINYLMQTFRHRNFILIMNSPFMDFIDSGTRKLFHAELRTAGIDFKKKQVKLRPNLIQYNPRLKKFYYHRLRVITGQGRIPVDIWRVDKPPKDVIVEYEKRRQAFTDKLNREIQAELQSLEDKKVSTRHPELTRNQEEILEMLKEGLRIDEIATQTNRSQRTIQKTVQAIEKKGWRIKPVRDESDSSHRRIVRYYVLGPEKHEIGVSTQTQAQGEIKFDESASGEML